MHPLAVYLALLGLTLAVELPLVVALAGRGRRGEVARACLALNLLTHPVATGLAWIGGVDWLALELGVLAVEALGYEAVTGLGRTRAAVVSVAANVSSAATGLLLAAGT